MVSHCPAARKVGTRVARAFADDQTPFRSPIIRAANIEHCQRPGLACGSSTTLGTTSFPGSSRATCWRETRAPRPRSSSSPGIAHVPVRGRGHHARRRPRALRPTTDSGGPRGSSDRRARDLDRRAQAIGVGRVAAVRTWHPAGGRSPQRGVGQRGRRHRRRGRWPAAGAGRREGAAEPVRRRGRSHRARQDRDRCEHGRARGRRRGTGHPGG